MKGIFMTEVSREREEREEGWGLLYNLRSYRE
jgi:hypothetical protein